MKFPEQFRVTSRKRPWDTRPGDTFGPFFIPGRAANGRSLNVIACDGLETGWEHVSVSIFEQPGHCPSWAEMCIVKELFWDDSECVVEFHVPKENHINVHDGCLHLWRCVNQPFPMPPKECV